MDELEKLLGQVFNALRKADEADLSEYADPERKRVEINIPQSQDDQ